MIRDLFQPREVRWVNKALDEVFLSAPSELYDPASNLKKRCKAIVSKSADDICRAIRVERNTPEIIATRLAANLSAEEIFFGNNFVYRGILSGNGHASLRLVEHLIKRQVVAGGMTQTEANDYLSELREEITKSG